MLKFGAITCVVMLILGILAAGSEFRHRTIVPVLLATPHRARIFAVKVAVIAVLGAAFSAVVFGLGLGYHRPDAVGARDAPPAGRSRPALRGTVLSSACFGMIGVALGALTRNTIGAIVAAIAWTLFIEQVILNAIVPHIEKWLPTAAAIGLTNAPGPDPGPGLVADDGRPGSRRLRHRAADRGQPPPPMRAATLTLIPGRPTERGSSHQAAAPIIRVQRRHLA